MTEPLEQHPVSEARLESFFAKRVQLAGGYSVKLAPTTAGVPDRLVMFPGGRVFLVELKTLTGKLRPIQTHWHRMARERYGVQVFTVYGELGVLEWIRGVVSYRDPQEKPRGRPRKAG